MGVGKIFSKREKRIIPGVSTQIFPEGGQQWWSFILQYQVETNNNLFC